jgi:exodeoxyribonuclease VII large subunit
MAVPVRAELVGRTLDLGRRLVLALGRGLDRRRTEVTGLGRRLPEPQRLVEERTQRLDHALSGLRRVVALLLGERGRRLAVVAGRLRHPREVVEAKRARLAEAAGALRPRDFGRELGRRQDEIGRLGTRMADALTRRLERAGERVTAQARLLDGLGYQQVLARGFVLARDRAGHPVTSAAAAPPGTALTLTFHDGERAATVDGVRAARPADTPKPQGTLL